MIWRGFDKDGSEVELTGDEIATKYPMRPYNDHWAIHRGKVRLAASAYAAKLRGWPEVAELFRKRRRREAR